MSKFHLAAGSECPPLVEGKLRLYSMEFCPYAQRPRLILDVKNIPHDIVNVNLVDKPEWLFKIHPEGKVPALDTGSQIVVESLDICDYINDKYPDPPLYPADSNEKQAQQDIIKKFGELTGVFTQILLGKEQKSPEDWLKDLHPHLELLENAIDKAGGIYFGGDTPNMVDYMIWPWGERAGVVPMILGAKLPIGENDYVKLRAWRKAMRQRPEVTKIYHGPEKFHKCILIKTKQIEPNYDVLFD